MLMPRDDFMTMMIDLKNLNECHDELVRSFGSEFCRHRRAATDSFSPSRARAFRNSLLFFLLIFLEGSSSRVHGSRVRHFKKKFPNSKESKHSFETFLSSFVRSLSLSGSNNNNDNIRHHFWGSSLAVVPKSRSKTFWFRFLRSAAVQIRNVDFTTEIALGHPDVCCH